jgi:hypothetical protein
MKDLLMILLVLLTVACKNNPKQSIRDNSSSSDTSKTLTYQIHNHYYQLDTVPFVGYLNDPKLDSSVISYCRGNFHIDPDKRTLKFLEMISTKKDKYFPLYFAVFNKILNNSDGAIGELMGPYCYNFVITHPNEVLEHFLTNKKDLYLSTMFLGAEFYFKSRNTTFIKLNFGEFKEYLDEKLDSNNIEIKNISHIFYTKIDSMMKWMKDDESKQDSLLKLLK